MKRTLIIGATLLVLNVAGVWTLFSDTSARADSDAVQAAVTEQTLTFAVEKMTCALCPVTVKKAMEGVEGVESVSVDFDAKTATVVFDPSLATPEMIAEAAANAGYPAHPIGAGPQ